MIISLMLKAKETNHYTVSPKNNYYRLVKFCASKMSLVLKGGAFDRGRQNHKKSSHCFWKRGKSATKWYYNYFAFRFSQESSGLAMKN